MIEKQTTQTPTEARQGKTGVGVRYVLMVSFVLVIIAFILVYKLLV